MSDTQLQVGDEVILRGRIVHAEAVWVEVRIGGRFFRVRRDACERPVPAPAATSGTSTESTRGCVIMRFFRARRDGYRQPAPGPAHRGAGDDCPPLGVYDG